MASAGPLHIVLFGPPRAGKTGLVAALGQLREEHPGQIHGKLDDPTGDLERQRYHFYDAVPKTTDNETELYLVRLRPDGQEPVEAVLVDSDGRVAVDLLKEGQVPAPGARGELARAVVEADALVVVVDATMSAEQSGRVFENVARFLRAMERARGGRAEVAGLPVFLVLTKCDLLAREGDGTVEWLDRIEDRKRELDAQLRAVLGADRPDSFGRLDLRLSATAMKKPALGRAHARPREPFGVAELFEESLAAAGAYRRRQASSGRRLRWTTAGSTGVAAGLAGLVLVLLSGLGRHDPGALQRRVEQYQLREGSTLTARLHDWPEDLERRQEELKEIREDPDFEELPGHLQEFVKDRAKELEDYLPYLREVLRLSSTMPRDDQQLAARLRELEQEAPLPEAHPEWAASGAGLLRQQRIDDLGLLRERADRAEAWFNRLRQEGLALWTFRRPPRGGPLINWDGWQEEVDRYLARAAAPPPAVEDLPPTSLVTAANVLQFDRVRRARETVQAGVRELEAIRDITSALGLADPTPLRPDSLVIPRAGLTGAAARKKAGDLAFRPELAAGSLALATTPLAAGAAFPPTHDWVISYPDALEEFKLAAVPDAAREVVLQSAGNNYRYLTGPLRDLIAARYQRQRSGDEEKASQWRALGRWLAADPPELRHHRRLAVVLARLFQSSPVDPVASLALFLERTEYPLALRNPTVTIPFDWNASLPETAVLTLSSGDETATFMLDPSATRRDPQNRTTTYSFRGEVNLTYKPGDPFSLTLPLRDDRRLVWSDSRTKTYAFEALSRPPRLGPRGQAGERADGIVLRWSVSPPSVPDLLPPADPR